MYGPSVCFHHVVLHVHVYVQSVHLDSGQLVKAVDKLSGKLQAMNRLLPAAGLEQ